MKGVWVGWAIVSLLGLQAKPLRAGVVDSVDTRRGTNSRYAYSHGNTFPATARPFGFNMWTPITEPNSEAWLYRYDAPTLVGIGITHQPSPWMRDYGTLQVWGGPGDVALDWKARRSPFHHGQETARPNRYVVTLDNGMHIAVAPSDRAGLIRLVYPTDGAAYLLFDTVQQAQGHLDIDVGAGTLSGFTDHGGERLYVFATWGSLHDAHAQPAAPAHAGAFIAFTAKAGQTVLVKIGTSWISTEQARSNLISEIGDKSWEAVAQEGERAWESVLAQLDVEASEEQRRTLAGNLYRTHIYPSARWELVDGTPQHLSPYDHQLHPGKMWVNNGFWDTSRALWPLLMLINPEQTGDMLNGFAAAYLEGGWTPRWTSPGYRPTMVGTHTDIVFADAYAKGIRNFAVQAAYDSAVKNATVYSGVKDRGRAGLHRSNFLGYVPVEAAEESAAWFLEDRVNDFGIAVLAAGLGDSVAASYFNNRARQYQNLFSPTVGFFRGRKADGTWRTSDSDFHPNEWGWEFTEGCPWHYATAAPHDPHGLALLYGGSAGLIKKIDDVFAAPRDYRIGGYKTVIHEMVEAFDADMGQYAHANEPVHHMLYMYNYAGAPAKTQERVRAVMDPAAGLYTSGEDGGGYLGDEDNGQMSAWYIFSALGFYPASVGHPEYAIGSPLYRRATVHMATGKQFTVLAPQNSASNIYVQSATLNGVPYDKNYLRHEDVAAGGTLVLTMGPRPSSWGSHPQASPTSLTVGDTLAPLQIDLIDNAKLTASSNSGTLARLIDNDATTSWTARDPHPAVTCSFKSTRRPFVQQYTITSSADEPASDPHTWLLQGSDDGVNWDTLDERAQEVFRWRHQTRVFGIAKPKAYSRVRLQVSRKVGEPPMAMAEWELLGVP